MWAIITLYVPQRITSQDSIAWGKGLVVDPDSRHVKPNLLVPQRTGWTMLVGDVLASSDYRYSLVIRGVPNNNRTGPKPSTTLPKSGVDRILIAGWQ